MDSVLSYRVDEDRVLARLRSFYEDKGDRGILASMQVPSRELRRFAETHQAGYCDYPDPEERIRFWDRLLMERRAVNDDSVPSACLSEFDQGIYGGLLGGQVRFQCFPEDGWISSMVAPLLADWSGFEKLVESSSFDSGNRWIQMLERQTEIFMKAARGRFGVSHLILINGLNFVFELVGATETYLSLSIEPAMVRAAIRFALDLNLKIQSLFFQLVPMVKGGTCSYVGQWIPGRVVNESADPFHMTSVDCFEQWGRGPIEDVFSSFDGGVIHIHANGRHLLPAVCSLKGLKAVHLMNDRGYPSAFEVAGELKRGCLENIPVIVADVEYRAFKDALDRHSLAGGVFYQVVNVPDGDEANRSMDKVRAYSWP